MGRRLVRRTKKSKEEKEVMNNVEPAGFPKSMVFHGRKFVISGVSTSS